MRQRQQRAIQQISADLYSSSTHFVMELLQNCDDNEYESGVEPRMSIELTNDAVIVRCNERGFNRDNVVALCDVKQSTKSKRVGFIGQKGIGFKGSFIDIYEKI